jgi:hypothetical protein
MSTPRSASEARSPLLRERALFGLARTYEALSGTRRSQGELEKAIQNYQELVSNKNYKDGAVLLPGQGSPGGPRHYRPARTFYDQFAHFDPQPKLLAAPDGAQFRLQEPPGATARPVVGLDWTSSSPTIGQKPGKSADQDKGAKTSSRQGRQSIASREAQRPARPAREAGEEVRKPFTTRAR